MIVLPSGEFRGAFLVQDTAYGVANPTFGPASLTATYGGSVPVTAYRLGTAGIPAPTAINGGGVPSGLGRRRPSLASRE